MEPLSKRVCNIIEELDENEFIDRDILIPTMKGLQEFFIRQGVFPRVYTKIGVAISLRYPEYDTRFISNYLLSQKIGPSSIKKYVKLIPNECKTNIINDRLTQKEIELIDNFKNLDEPFYFEESLYDFWNNTTSLSSNLYILRQPRTSLEFIYLRLFDRKLNTLGIQWYQEQSMQEEVRVSFLEWLKDIYIRDFFEIECDLEIRSLTKINSDIRYNRDSELELDKLEKEFFRRLKKLKIMINKFSSRFSKYSNISKHYLKRLADIGKPYQEIYN